MLGPVWKRSVLCLLVQFEPYKGDLSKCSPSNTINFILQFNKLNWDAAVAFRKETQTGARRTGMWLQLYSLDGNTTLCCAEAGFCFDYRTVAKLDDPA